MTENSLLFLKRLASWGPIQQAITNAFNLGCLCLVLPYSPRITIPAFCAVVGSVLLGWHQTQKPRRRQIVSALLATVGVSWAVFAPYFALSGVTYSVRAESNDPLASRILPLHSGSLISGHLLYLTDPIRPPEPVRKLVELLGLRVELIAKVPGKEPAAITIPISTAIRRKVLGAGTSISAEQLMLLYTGPRLLFDISDQPGSHAQMRIALSVQVFPLVDYVRPVSSTAERSWETITYAKGDERQAALYAAQLDSGLDAASVGDFETAIGALESASDLAPTELERSRLNAVLGAVSQAAIGGNIGSTQGLAFYNQAMRFWPRVGSDHPLALAQLENPVDRWLYFQLSGVFFDRQEEYPNWRQVFGYSSKGGKTVETTKIKDREFWRSVEIYPKKPEEALISAERQRLTEILGQGRLDPPGVNAALNGFISSDPETARWAFTVLIGAAFLADDSKSMRWPTSAWQEALNFAASLCAEPWRSQYRNLLAFIKGIDPISFRDPVTERRLDDLVRLFSQAGFGVVPKTETSSLQKLTM